MDFVLKTTRPIPLELSIGQNLKKEDRTLKGQIFRLVECGQYFVHKTVNDFGTSETRWTYYFFNIWSLRIMKKSPVVYKLCKKTIEVKLLPNTY